MIRVWMSKSSSAGFVVLAVQMLVVLGASFSPASQGDGPPAPRAIVQIHSIGELQNITGDLAGRYELAGDIDATETKGWNGNRGFDPVGSYDGDYRDLSAAACPEAFTGTFDGAGHTIRNLCINRSSENCTGLFGCIGPGATIRNVLLAEYEYWGNVAVGGLVGLNAGGNISECYASGSAWGQNGSGGLVGMNFGNITGCRSDAGAGGSRNLGGLVGWNGAASPGLRGRIERSFTSLYGGSTGGLNNNGGLAGGNEGTISDCYSMIYVQGGAPSGGLVGFNNGSIVNSYSTGQAMGYRDIGGLVGLGGGSGTVSGCYWDRTTSGLGSSAGGMPRDTADMMKQATFNGWDFVSIWNITEDKTYPFLRSVALPPAPVDYPPVWSAVPGDASLIEGSEFSFAARATDPNGDAVTYNLSPANLGMTVGSASGALLWRSVPVGNFTFNLTATDGRSTIWHVFNLTVRPYDHSVSETVILSPANQTMVKGHVTIYVGILPCRCPGATRLYIDGVFQSNGTRTPPDVPGTETFYHVWNSRTAADGWHNITALGKHGDPDTIFLLVNNSDAPEVKNTKILAPENGSSVRGLVNVVAGVIPCDCLGLTRLYVDGAFIATGTREKDQGGLEVFDHAWNTTGFGEGWHNVTVTGKHPEYCDTVFLFVNNSPAHRPGQPVILWPGNYSHISGTVNVSVRVDSDISTKTTSFYMDGTFINNGTSNGGSGDFQFFLHPWDTLTVQNGLHAVTVFGKDRALAATIFVFVDNSLPPNREPVISALSGPQNSTVEHDQAVSFSVEAFDPDGDVLSYRWTENGTVLSTARGFSRSFPPGKHLVELTVDDGRHGVVRTFGFEVRPPPGPAGGRTIRIPGPETGYVLAGMLAIAALGLIWASATEVGKYRLLLVLFLPLYTRLHREEVLDNETRGLIRGFICADPGIHYNELLHRLKLGNGAAVHHLATLEREGVIKSRRDGGLKRFYPGEMRLLGLPPRLNGLQQLILQTVQRQEGLSQMRIASLLEVPYLTVHRHISKMASLGVIRLERRGISVRCYLANGESGRQDPPPAPVSRFPRG